MLSPPSAVVRGLTQLQRELYVQRLVIPAARLPAQKVGGFRSRLPRDLILSLPRVRSVINDTTGNDPSKRILLLSPEHVGVEEASDTAPLKRLFRIKTGQECELLSAVGLREFDAEPLLHELVLDYEHWSCEEVLQATLPEDIEVPSSFETVGHVAHVNLRSEQEPYKQLIGQVLLSKNPHLRTVVNKLGTIDTTFRFFHMEILAGVDDLCVEVREEGCIFAFDYGRVYWNSRLQAEHRRLVQLFKPGERVCDLFAGVGPFALPAAKKGCLVYGNDLNPDSVKYLLSNRERNKIAPSQLCVHNSDARDFVVQSLVHLNHGSPSSAPFLFFHHYIMNLPASAHEFLDAFGPLMRDSRRCQQQSDSDHGHPIMVHCYVFCKTNQTTGAAMTPEALVMEKLGVALPEADISAHFVRNVAPHKDMFCVSFKLPFLGNAHDPDNGAVKKSKIECE